MTTAEYTGNGTVMIDLPIAIIPGGVELRMQDEIYSESNLNILHPAFTSED